MRVVERKDWKRKWEHGEPPVRCTCGGEMRFERRHPPITLEAIYDKPKDRLVCPSCGRDVSNFKPVFSTSLQAGFGEARGRRGTLFNRSIWRAVLWAIKRWRPQSGMSSKEIWRSIGVTDDTPLKTIRSLNGKLGAQNGKKVRRLVDDDCKSPGGAYFLFGVRSELWTGIKDWRAV